MSKSTLNLLYFSQFHLCVQDTYFLKPGSFSTRYSSSSLIIGTLLGVEGCSDANVLLMGKVGFGKEGESGHLVGNLRITRRALATGCAEAGVTAMVCGCYFGSLAGDL